MEQIAHPKFANTFYVQEQQVGCDGGNGALGHPLVFLEVEDNGGVICPYCSRKFLMQEA